VANSTFTTYHFFHPSLSPIRDDHEGNHKTQNPKINNSQSINFLIREDTIDMTRLPSLNLGAQQPETLPNPFEATPMADIAPNDDSLLAALSQQIAADGSILRRRRPNFPSLCPVVYHNITQEISARHSFPVHLSLFAARSVSVSLFVNFMCSMQSGSIKSSTIECWREVVLSAFAVLVCPIALFHVQYFPLYFSVRDEQPKGSLIPLQFFVIFCLFFLVVGVPGSGIIGAGYSIVAFRYGTFWNQLYSVVITLWHIVNVILEIIVLLTMNALSQGPIHIANPADIVG
jgi:hypothetical protein